MHSVVSGSPDPLIPKDTDPLIPKVEVVSDKDGMKLTENLVTYYTYPKCMDTPVWTNSADSDQRLQNATSD